jgi:hypothetical protein
MVEAGGQHIRGFRRGLDYAFITAVHRRQLDAERVIRLSAILSRILVPAPEPSFLGGSMSLYRAGLKLALFLPLGVAMPSCDGEGFTDVSSVVCQASRPGATH